MYISIVPVAKNLKVNVSLSQAGMALRKWVSL